MKYLFDDESFPFETLRTAGFTIYGGARPGRGPGHRQPNHQRG